MKIDDLIRIDDIDVRKILRATQKVALAEGFSDAYANVSVDVYKDIGDSTKYPEFGFCSSIGELVKLLRDKIDKKYPIEAFPYRKIYNAITLYRRNPDDYEYLSYVDTLNLDELSEND